MRIFAEIKTKEKMQNNNKMAARGLVLDYPFRHTMPVQLRFNDIDSLGHVNNSVYFPLFDLGKARYFNAARGEDVDWGKADIVVANINCNFLAPIYFNEKISVETQVSRIGDRSFTMNQRLVNTDTAETKCVCTTVMVGFDVQKGVSAPVADVWKQAISKFEQRKLEEMR